MARPYIYLSPVRGDRTNCVYICHIGHQYL